MGFIVNGAPPQHTQLTDEFNRITVPWFSYLATLQRSNSTVVLGDGGLDLNGKTITGSGTFAGAITFALAPTFGNPAGVRSNLGLGSAATQPASAFDGAGAAAAAIAASLQRASNLSDLANVATARANLGLGSAATQPSSAFDTAGAAAAAIAASLQRASNLSDLANVATARANLGVPVLGGSNTFGGAQVVQVAAQASVDLYDTIAPGSRWRVFADNAGGGGGALTFGFYDLANARLGGGFDSAGWFNASNGLLIGNAANISFGSNYQNWTPTISASGSMTVSGLSVMEARYIRVGPFVLFTLSVSFDLGGTASTTLFLNNFPVAAVISPLAVTMLSAGLYLPGVVGNEVAFGYMSNGTGATVTRSGAPAFPLVNGVLLYLSGAYRVA